MLKKKKKKNENINVNKQQSFKQKTINNLKILL